MRAWNLFSFSKDKIYSFAGIVAPILIRRLEVIDSMDALIVDDILHDFVYGKLKSKRARSIIPKTKLLISAARRAEGSSNLCL